MHKYIPNTDDEQKLMMEKIGITGIGDLFSVIPKEIRQRNGLDLPEKMTEQELVSFLGKMAGENMTTDDLVCFLGAGTYDHYIPSVVGAMASRSEFYTAYTPYQAEISQGMLQAIFEFQTMVCELTGMEAANASMYDGASATAEAFAISLVSSRNKNNIIVSSSVHPETREVIRTYMSGRNVEIREIPLKDGETDYAALEGMCDGSTAAICIQSPNFLGIIENMEAASEIA
ncbi:MAG: glycine dehydrogenase, partial [Clostridia bacterium]|nr:glycine dehydrogenase [Clostridia bacterium]